MQARKTSHLILTFLLGSLACFASSGQTDSTRVKRAIVKCISHSGNLSASYTHYKNWKYNGYNNLSFLIRQNLCYDSTSTRTQTHIRANAELGYMKFSDSSWYKNSDYIDIGADLLRNNSKALHNTFSFYFNSQILSSYEDLLSDSGRIERRWVAGFGNPMKLDLGYGTTVKFWQNCRITLTFATLRTSITPVTGPFAMSDNSFIYKHGALSSEYGVSLQTNIRRNLNRHIRWENNSRCFANATHRQRIDIDFRNRLIIHLIKYLDLILDSRIRYVPYPPFKFQFRNELMLSFAVEKWK